MAAVSVAFDGTRLNNADTDTNWHLLDSGSKATVNPDFLYQGGGSISRKVGKTTDGLEYDPGSGGVDFTTPKVWLAKIIVTTSGLLETTRALGQAVRIGSAQTDYYILYLNTLATYPATKSWLIIPIDPNLVAFRDGITGTPVLTAVDYFAEQAQMTAAARDDNVAMDSIDYMDSGKGLTLTGGDGGDADGIFQDFLDEDEGQLTNGRWGVVSSLEGIIYVIGTLTIGSAIATVFQDSNRTLVFIAGIVDEGFCGIAIGLSNASQDIDFASCSFIGRGIATVKRFFDTALEVDGTNEEIDLQSHGYETGDYVLYSKEGGSDVIGLTDATKYWVNVVTANSISLHTTRTDAYAGTSKVGLTAASGENHSFAREPDNRPELTVTGTTGAFDTDACVLDTFRKLTLTSVCSLVGGFILRTGNITLSTGVLDGVTLQDATLEEGDALVDPVSDLEKIVRCEFIAAIEGHAIRITGTGTPKASNANKFTNFWSPAANGWNFHTITGVDASTDVITTDANHGFTDGDAVYYNNGGGTDTIGLTHGNKYYIGYLSATTFTLHETKVSALAASSKINLSDGATGETHSIYSSKAAIFNDSGIALTVNVTNLGDTPSIRNGTSASTTVNNAVDISINCVDADNNPVGNVSCAIFAVDDDSQLMNEDSNVTTGIATESYNYLGDRDVYWRVRESPAAGARYKAKSGIGEIKSTGFEVTVIMEIEPLA